MGLDYALIYAHTADRAGNLEFRGANRNFGPSFAKAARVVIAEVDEIVEAGQLPPDQVDLPGIFVDRVVRSPVPRAPSWPVPRPDDERRDYRDADGSFANWTTPEMGGGAIGGAMDLVVRPGKLIIAMRHCERSGRPKVMRECEYPVTRTGRVDLIVTDLAVIERDERGLVLRECAPGFEPDDIKALTGAPLTVGLWAKRAGQPPEGFLAWRESVSRRGKPSMVKQPSRKTEKAAQTQGSGG